MDYTTLAYCKSILDNTETTDDTLLGKAITAASRFIDRRCTGVERPEVADYFALADVANEEIKGQVDVKGRITCWPRKPALNSVSALAYRRSPLQEWTSVDATLLEADGGQAIAWASLRERGSLRVKLSYNGGLAGTVDDLPADFVEIATILAVRFYREDKSSLSDAIGIADTGMMQYTKALPPRVVEMMKPWRRVVPW
jgi:hypothetical protein